MCSWRGKQNDWELLAKIVLFLALIDILERKTWWIMIFQENHYTPSAQIEKYSMLTPLCKIKPF